MRSKQIFTTLTDNDGRLQSILYYSIQILIPLETHGRVPLSRPGRLNHSVRTGSRTRHASNTATPTRTSVSLDNNRPIAAMNRIDVEEDTVTTSLSSDPEQV